MIQLLLAYALKGVVLLGLAGGLVALCRTKTAEFRHAIWAAALAGLVIMLPLSGLLPRLHLGWVAGGRAGLGPNLLVLVWLLPAGLLLLSLLCNHIALARLRRAAVPVRDPVILALAANIARELGISRPVALICYAAPMPRTFGILRPVVLLPAGVGEWSHDRLQMTLLHEFAHVARLDAATLTLARFAAALHWFNPLAWLALRSLNALAERACDARVMGTGAVPGAYARLLLETARKATTSGRREAGAVAMTAAEDLEERLRLIMSGRTGGDRPRAGQLALVSMIAALVTFGLAPLRGEAPTHFGRIATQPASSAFSSE